MAYVTPTAVFARDTGRVFNQTSKPTASQVSEYVDQVAGEIEGVLRKQGYAIPIATGATSALAYLENLNAMGAACLIQQSATTPGNQANWCKMYADALKMLAAGNVQLEAGTVDAEVGLPRQRTRATSMFNACTEF